MKTYGLVLETYGRYAKVKTKDGEYIIKSDKKPPKEGTKIEVKDFGKGDYTAKILAKKPSDFIELPKVRFVDMAEKISERLSMKTIKNGNFITTAIALFLEELSNRIDISKELLEKLQKLLNGEELSTEDKKLDLFLNLLSGRYSLRNENGSFIFLDRKNSTFHIFTQDNRIFGKIEEGSFSTATVYFDKFPENIELLENNLKKHFNLVSIKLASFSESIYV